MILYISLGLLLAALGGLWGLCHQQVLNIRAGRVVTSYLAVAEKSEYWQRQIDGCYHGFSFFFKQLGHYTYFYVLVAMKQTSIAFRYFLCRVEGKCTHLIDSVHRHGLIDTGHQASSFLHQIKQHKDQAAIARLRAE